MSPFFDSVGRRRSSASFLSASSSAADHKSTRGGRSSGTFSKRPARVAPSSAGIIQSRRITSGTERSAAAEVPNGPWWVSTVWPWLASSVESLRRLSGSLSTTRIFTPSVYAGSAEMLEAVAALFRQLAEAGQTGDAGQAQRLLLFVPRQTRRVGRRLQLV